MNKKYIFLILIFIVMLIILKFILLIFEDNALYTVAHKIDWNNVSAIADSFIALFTLIAIFIAIYVPQKDRITSSKIELFTQRFETYYFIVTIFKTAFEKGKSNFEDSELMKYGMKSCFLLDEQDNKKLGEICKTINKKISQKYLDELNPDLSISIDRELDDIDKVFEKYLNLRTYGVENN